MCFRCNHYWKRYFECTQRLPTKQWHGYWNKWLNSTFNVYMFVFFMFVFFIICWDLWRFAKNHSCIHMKSSSPQYQMMLRCIVICILALPLRFLYDILSKQNKYFTTFYVIDFSIMDAFFRLSLSLSLFHCLKFFLQFYFPMKTNHSNVSNHTANDCLCFGILKKKR